MDNDRIWNLIAKKLAGEASPDDLTELETTLRLNPELHYSLEAMHEMWKNKSEPAPNQAEIAFQEHVNRMRALGMDMGKSEKDSPVQDYPVSPLRWMNWKKLAFVASGFLLLTLGFHFISTHNSTDPAVQKRVLEVVTRNGTKTNILLPDGSTVWLNAGSRLSYDSLYDNMLREVTLSGEAYFDVVKNPDKPFIIHTGKINIKVLGTIFNVKSYPGEKTIETSLIKGSIEVTFPSQPAKKIILKPNQKLVINKTETTANTNINHAISAVIPFISIEHLKKIGSDSAIAETGWMQNRLYFNDMSFNELLKNMERKYGLSFSLTDPGLDTIHFTGSFQNETILQALDALRLTAVKSTADFTYEMQGNQVFIYNNKTSVHSIQPK
jgi:transmembrane sensor